MTAAGAAQDPGELFDVLRADGTPTGRRKARAAVHRDGDWHRALHVWVAGVGDDGPFLTFQRRSPLKDTWPNRLDATVGGHFRAGESLADALRETEEEIGTAVLLDQLRPLGVRVCVNEAAPGSNDHELQEVFLLRDDRPLTMFRPHPVELAALVRFSLADLLPLLAGERDAAPGETLRPGDTETTRATYGPADFIPGIDRYFFRVAVAADAVLRGARWAAV